MERLPRWVWIIASGVIAYLFMLTDVLSYLLKALAWQGVFVTAWVAIALVYIAMTSKNDGALPEIAESGLRPVAAGAIVWVLASAIGIYLTEQHASANLAALAPLITVAITGLGYVATFRLAPPATTPATEPAADGVAIEPNPA